MAWDFSTEPEFQEQLDWVAEFCRAEVEPLELVFPGAPYSRDPKAKALADPLKQQVKDRGLWALFLDKELGGPGFGQLKLALLNERGEIIARGEDLHLGAEVRKAGSADVDGFQGASGQRCGFKADAGVVLAAVGIAFDREIHQPQARLRGVRDFAG